MFCCRICTCMYFYARVKKKTDSLSLITKASFVQRKRLESRADYPTKDKATSGVG